MKNVTLSQAINIFWLMLAFAFGRTAIFIQIISTPLASKAMRQQGNQPSGIDSIPLAFVYFGGTFIAPLASKLMERIGRQKGFIIGCISGILGAGINVIATYLQYEQPKSGFVIYFGLLCLGSLFLGFANGFVQFFRYAAADAPERRGLAIAIVLVGGDASALIGPSLSVWTKNLFTWIFGATYLVIIGLFAITILVLLAVKIPNVPYQLVDNRPPRKISQLLRIPRFFGALTTSTIGFSMMVFLMVLIPLVMDKLKFSFEDIATVIQIHSIGMFVPGIFIGFAIEKFGTLIIDFLGLCIIVISNVIMIIGSNNWNNIVGMLLLGIGWNLVFVSSTTLLTQTYRPSEKAKAQGFNDFILFFIVSTFSLTAAELWELLGSWKAANYFSLGLCIAGTFVIILIVLLEKILNYESTEETKALINRTEYDE